MSEPQSKSRGAPGTFYVDDDLETGERVFKRDDGEVAQFYYDKDGVLRTWPETRDLKKEDIASEPTHCSWFWGEKGLAATILSAVTACGHCNRTSPYFSPRIDKLLKLQTMHNHSESIDRSSESALDGDESNQRANQVELENLLRDHSADDALSSFFRSDNYSDLEIGDQRIGRGGQAEVFLATVKMRDECKRQHVAAKVFRKDQRLDNLQKYWPEGLMAGADFYNSQVAIPYICWAFHARVLPDGRFAFLFPLLKSDLRKRIDDAMVKRNGVGPPFSPYACFCVISDIAAGMAILHGRNMFHHDLKAANLLDLRDVCQDEECIMILLADFESSVGMVGTGYWRAPEIFRALKENHGSEGVVFTKEADVYSFAMTCYEVITGLEPFEGHDGDCRALRDGICCRDNPKRPTLPDDVHPALSNLVRRCWDSEPSNRPSFKEIRSDLQNFGKTHGWQNPSKQVACLGRLAGTTEFGNLYTRSKQEDKLDGPFSICVTPNYSLRDDWQWPIYDRWKSNDGLSHGSLRVKPKKNTKVNADEVPFQVLYDVEGQAMVGLRSQHIIKVAKKCLPYHEEEFSNQMPNVVANDMFVALKAFKKENQSIQNDSSLSSLQKAHFKHLLRFLETEYKDTTAQVERMREEKKVSFQLLWAFFYKGDDLEVYYTCRKTGQTLLGIVTHSYYKSGQNQFRVILDCRDYNGTNYVKGNVIFPVNEFNGETSFESIGICPMHLLEQSTVDEMKKAFLANGTKFYNIVVKGRTFMQYVGLRVYVNSDGGLHRVTADGRVMVDLRNFAKSNPNYSLGNAEPPKSDFPNALHPASGDEIKPEEIKPEDLMLAPAFVYGFSFSNKSWGAFDINGLSEVRFDEMAFDRDLVLTDANRKGMLLAIVKQYTNKHSDCADVKSAGIDPISNKGDGCIFLCYGPPGTGKTLTVESIAERLHCPLWSVSVSELGSTPETLEKNLLKIFEIAFEWRSVLLLDEADLYLERRTNSGDPHRTAMTSIFLRVLEYYRGVLFLTTNRVSSFDDAFCSRISMFLHYPPLSSDQRKKVWRSLLSRAQVKNPDLERFKDSPALNGREIRNSIQIAQTWAMSSGMDLTSEKVLEVVQMLGEFREGLKSAGESISGSFTQSLVQESEA